MRALVEHYVDNRHPAASDSNVGTQDAPFRTIQAAIDTASDGDTVWVKPGIYRETVKVTKSGFSRERPFRIAATEQRKAIIRGSDMVEDWQLVGASLFRTLWPHKTRPRKEEMFGFRSYPDQVFIDGQLLKHVERRDELEANCFWVDRQNGYIHMHLPPGESPAGRCVEISRREQWFVAEGVRHFHLSGLMMEHSTGSIQVAGCRVSGEECLIEGNEFARAGAGVGLSYRGDRNVVSGNIIHHNGQMGFGGGGREVLFEENYVHHNNTRNIVDWESGVGKVVYSHHSIYRHNVFSETAVGPGLWFDIDNYFNVIEKNTFHNIGASAIMVEISYGNLIRNNIITDTNRIETPYRSYGSTGIQVQLSCKTRIYNNVIYNTNGYGIHLRWHVRKRDHHFFRPEDPEEFRKVHGFDQSEWMGPNDQYPLANNEIYNNIIMDNSRGAIRIDFHRDYVYGNKSDYNLFWDSTNRHPMDGGHRLLEWQETTGLDQHSVYSKEMHDGPLFVNLSSFDFRLAEGSPAIGAGVSLEEVTDDFVGNPRPSDRRPDIGPFQL